MTEAAFRNECLTVMGEHRREDVFSWSISYLLVTLRYHGLRGEALRRRAVDAGL